MGVSEATEVEGIRIFLVDLFRWRIAKKGQAVLF